MNYPALAGSFLFDLIGLHDVSSPAAFVRLIPFIISGRS